MHGGFIVIITFVGLPYAQNVLLISQMLHACKQKLSECSSFLCVLVDLNQAVQLDTYQVLWGDVGIPHLSIRVKASPLLTSFLKKCLCVTSGMCG